MKGEYAVRAEHLQQYHAHLQALERGFAEVRFVWVRRSENRRADALSKEALEELRGARRRPSQGDSVAAEVGDPSVEPTDDDDPA